MDRTTLCKVDASKMEPGPSNPLMTSHFAMVPIEFCRSQRRRPERNRATTSARCPLPRHHPGGVLRRRLSRRGATAEVVGSSNPLLPWGQQALSLDHPVSPRRDRSSLTLHCAADPVNDCMTWHQGAPVEQGERLLRLPLLGFDFERHEEATRTDEGRRRCSSFGNRNGIRPEFKYLSSNLLMLIVIMS